MASRADSGQDPVMPDDLLSHPDRIATTLATLDRARAARAPGGNGLGEGAADCRINVKLALWRALRAAQRSPLANAHLEAYPREGYPDLWAGTVQDGVALGFLNRLEEVCSLADAESPPPPPLQESAKTTESKRNGLFTGKDLRRKKDILVASDGPRIRFSRRGGLLFVDREQEVHSENCLWFEARRDYGTLDNFAGADDERARLFSAQFLKPVRFLSSPGYSELELSGRLGRGPVGWPCRVTISGHANDPSLRLVIELSQNVVDWRLRSRFLGVPASLIQHHCTPVREIVTTERGSFVADTLVRSCGKLLVDGQPVAVPTAARLTDIRHTFSLGKSVCNP